MQLQTVGMAHHLLLCGHCCIQHCLSLLHTTLPESGPGHGCSWLTPRLPTTPRVREGAVYLQVRPLQLVDGSR